jgi:TatD DNase family protein
MMDAHLHLDRYPLERMDDLINKWRNFGIQGVVAVSFDLASSYRTLELKHRYPNFIYAAVGHHPEQAPPTDADINELLSLINSERESVSAIGEVGLPHYTLEEGEDYGEHLEWLEVFLSAAGQFNLPLALHAVHDKVAPVLDRLIERNIKHAHFHWLKASPDQLQRVYQAGYYLSLTPEVCYRERDQKIAFSAPIDRLLVETDGPWPFQGPFKGVPTSPELIRSSLKKIAVIKDRSVEELTEKTVENTMKLYRNE